MYICRENGKSKSYNYDEMFSIIMDLEAAMTFT